MTVKPFLNKPELSNPTPHLDVAVSRIKAGLPRFTYKSQNHSSVNNIYDACNGSQWTSGFWPGQIWLAYVYSSDPIFKYAGLIHSESLLERIENKVGVNHHDMGFLYSPSCTAAWEITGDENSKKAALLAADQMLTRWQETGGFVQAWGAMNDPKNYRFIIDCLMNLPLLYWATEQTGNPEYAQKATIHANTCRANSIREDNSTHHTFFMCSETGAPLRGETCQGYSDDSSWARGQAWAVYGAAIAYRYTKDAQWLNIFYRVTDYFISRLPEDLVPYWDLIFTQGDEPRDSSSAAIVACGLLEMASILTEANEVEKAQPLQKIASQLMCALAEKYAATGDTDGLLLHGTYSKKTPYNTCTPEGVDECVTWGDYFYMEGLLRLAKPDWRPYW